MKGDSVKGKLKADMYEDDMITLEAHAPAARSNDYWSQQHRRFLTMFEYWEVMRAIRFRLVYVAEEAD